MPDVLGQPAHASPPARPWASASSRAAPAIAPRRELGPPRAARRGAGAVGRHRCYNLDRTSNRTLYDPGGRHGVQVQRATLVYRRGPRLNAGGGGPGAGGAADASTRRITTWPAGAATGVRASAFDYRDPADAGAAAHLLLARPGEHARVGLPVVGQFFRRLLEYPRRRSERPGENRFRRARAQRTEPAPPVRRRAARRRRRRAGRGCARRSRGSRGTAGRSRSAGPAPGRRCRRRARAGTAPNWRSRSCMRCACASIASSASNGFAQAVRARGAGHELRDALRAGRAASRTG